MVTAETIDRIIRFHGDGLPVVSLYSPVDDGAAAYLRFPLPRRSAETRPQQAGTAAYDDHPWLSAAAATWLADRQVGLLGIDLPTPDLPVPRRPAEGFGWPVHKILLSRGVLIAEHLTGLAPLAGQRVEIIIGAVNIEGADGAPARILARPVPRIAR
jgi:kynurenine formamidase